MTFKTIFFMMAAILVLLFIVNYLNRNKSKTLSRYEAVYFEKVMAYKKQPSDKDLRQQAELAAREFGAAKGLSEKDILSMVQNDLGQE